MKIARKVNMSTGMPNIIQHKIAVNINSNALANVFKMELRLRRKRLVTMPMAALLKAIMMTPG